MRTAILFFLLVCITAGEGRSQKLAFETTYPGADFFDGNGFRFHKQHFNLRRISWAWSSLIRDKILVKLNYSNVSQVYPVAFKRLVEEDIGKIILRVQRYWGVSGGYGHVFSKRIGLYAGMNVGYRWGREIRVLMIYYYMDGTPYPIERQYSYNSMGFGPFFRMQIALTENIFVAAEAGYMRFFDKKETPMETAKRHRNLYQLGFSFGTQLDLGLLIKKRKATPENKVYEADTFSKFVFKTGATAGYFFDKMPFFIHNFSMLPLPHFSLSYTDKKHWFVELGYHPFASQYKMSYPQGKTRYRFSHTVAAGGGYRLPFSPRGIVFLPSFQIAYRTGKETQIDEQKTRHDLSYGALGLGTAMDVQFPITKDLFIGFEHRYTYFFDRKQTVSTGEKMHPFRHVLQFALTFGARLSMKPKIAKISEN